MAEDSRIWYNGTVMKNSLTMKAVVLAAMLASFARADDIPPPDEFGQHGSAGLVLLLCILPLVGAGCLYFAMRRRK